MSETQVPYTATSSVDVPFRIECTGAKPPDMREWLQNLRRDLLRKVKQIDDLLLTLPVDK